MKKISYPIRIYRLLPAFGLLALTSCVELEEKPESSLTSNQFYNSSSDAEAAVNSVYAGLNPNGQSLYRCLLQIGMEMVNSFPDLPLRLVFREGLPLFEPDVG